jgi:hypothetical protein
MKLNYLIILLALTACTKETIAPATQIKMKVCLDKCIRNTFENFHNSSFLSGSSSMDGLSQKQIFDRVITYCNKYYEGETCCKASGNDYTDKNVDKTHDYRVGACL